MTPHLQQKGDKKMKTKKEMFAELTPIEWASHGCEVWLLMPSRTDTKYFKKLADFRCFIWFFTGRLHFNESKNSAPFPTMLVRLGNDNWENSFAHGSVEEFIKICLE